MNRTHALVLSFLLIITSFGLAQQTPQQQPTQQPPAVASPAEPAQPAATTPATEVPPAEAAQPIAPIRTTDRDRQEVQALVQQFQQAAMQNDVGTLQRMLAPDYHAVNAQGVQEDRDDILKAHRNDDIKFDSVQVRQQDIEVNGNSATERNTADVRGVYKGQRFDGTYASTRTLQRTPDGWQIVSMNVQRVH